MFEFMLVSVVVLVVVVVVVVFVVVAFVLVALVLVLVLSVLVQPAQRLATVSKARSAKVRRIEFPPVPLLRSDVGELRELRSLAVTRKHSRDSSVLRV
jgi:hypothetical protein